MNIYVNEPMQIINKSRRYAKNLKKSGNSATLKVAVLGSCSIQYFTTVLRYLLHCDGIDVDIYESEYNGITMDVFDKQSALYTFNPNIVIILIHFLDVKIFPALLEEKEKTDSLINDTFLYYSNLWNLLSEIDSVQILQSNFVIPPEHILGNLENQSSYSKTRFYLNLNRKFVEEKNKNVIIVDVDLISNYVGKYQWIDYKSYFLNKAPCKIDFIPELANVFERQILAIKGKTKKCIVLDLDNTLWGGVVGDDGCDGIQLDPNNAIGEAYRYFQTYLLELKKRGVILAICSKNDEENAKEPFIKNRNMILQLDDISCFIANWENKADNIRRIARELNIGIDSLVFFDDNPAEREIVKRFVPECHVVEVPKDPANYVIQLDKECVFDWVQLTKEDIMRSNSYIENRNRTNLENQFVDYKEYLKALDMKGQAECLTSSDIERFTQLLNKSNQFNLRTQRYTESQIDEIINRKDGKCIYVRLQDKFSEFGIVSCVVLKKIESVCFIESWVMSCRVLKRGVEKFMFKKIIEESKNWGCRQIIGEYIESPKNGMVKDFYESLGFSLKENSNKKKKYFMELSGTSSCLYKDILIESIIR